ncbi:hypothetical protein HU200_016799 [Digitaria exilis]|uniref:Protein kinase domain-containing protein n=1 Tax=Digitaria exilis TaxID=1010633 RepID=A0A835F7E8_9POAL|nr:hypothetical protein HU200_016799 [Digitaria exilis]
MVDPAQIGLPGCNTTCGNLIVPYPFGISPGCYWPGFELFCDTSDDFPRLVIIDSGSILEVVDISLPDSTIRVSHRTSIIYNATNFSDKMLSDDKFQILDIMSETYTLSTRNELILFGCDVQATLHGEYTNGGGGNTSSSDNIISQCVSICTSGRDHGAGTPVVQGGNCSGHDGLSDFGASRYVPIEKTGLTTRVQGTIGYLDPMYFYTSRLTEKSDVYSFGVMLVELLTRKKPFSYLSNEGNGLVAHFVDLLAEGNLVQIIDPQVIEEGGEEIQEVAVLAASSVNIRVAPI